MNNDWKKKENTRHAAERTGGDRGRWRAHTKHCEPARTSEAGRDGLEGKHTDGKRGAATTPRSRYPLT